MDREARRQRVLAEALREQAGSGAVHYVRSPLRVCPLGAHIDHQHGCVTGLALDQAVLLAFRPRADRLVRLRSLDFAGLVEFSLEAIGPAQPGDWGNYPRGAAQVLRQQYGLDRGLDGVISGPLPVGGLSSSAAVDVAYLLAFETLLDQPVDRPTNVRLAQRIENDYIGLNNGILDQSMVLCAQAGALTWLDCRSLQIEQIGSPAALRYDLVVAYSGLSRALVGTAYNSRVAECADAARLLLQRGGLAVPEPPRLREVPAELLALGDELPPPLDRRVRHYAGEMQRVAAGVSAWQAGDLAQFGRLMRESGESSMHYYECGSPHLAALHELLNGLPGVYGARFSGAGFRGSCLALAEPGARETIASEVASRYPVEHPDVAGSYSLHFCAAGGPAEVL